MNTNRKLTTLFTALLVLAAAAASAEIYTQAPQRIREVPDYGPAYGPDGRPVGVEIWTDRGDGARYCAGDSIEVYFRTNADAWVAIYDVDTRGRVHKLFPSRHAPDNFARAHRTYRLPSRYGSHFEVEGPTGWETLRAVASTDPYALEGFRARPPRHPYDRRHHRDDRDNDWDSDRDRGRYSPTSLPASSRYTPAPKRIREVPDNGPHSPILSVAEARHFVRDGYRCRVPRPWWRRH